MLLKLPLFYFIYWILTNQKWQALYKSLFVTCRNCKSILVSIMFWTHINFHLFIHIISLDAIFPFQMDDKQCHIKNQVGILKTNKFSKTESNKQVFCFYQSCWSVRSYFFVTFAAFQYFFLVQNLKKYDGMT